MIPSLLWHNHHHNHHHIHSNIIHNFIQYMNNTHDSKDEHLIIISSYHIVRQQNFEHNDKQYDALKFHTLYDWGWRRMWVAEFKIKVWVLGWHFLTVRLEKNEWEKKSTYYTLKNGKFWDASYNIKEQWDMRGRGKFKIIILCIMDGPDPKVSTLFSYSIKYEIGLEV